MATLPHSFIVLVIMTVTSFCHADVATELEAVFDDVMINTTSPAVYESQKRMGATFGSVTIRNKIFSENLIAFRPPSLRGGCNGIDFFGGSLSFINANQLITLVRNIAQNSLSYGFYIAMQAICEDCAELMDTLQKKIQELNAMLGDSCKVAKKLVNATDINGFMESNNMTVDLGNANQGVSDFFDSMTGADGRTSDEKANSNAGSKQIRDEIKLGNLVWRALKEKSVETWFTSGDDQLLEFLMSLVGTHITRSKDESGTTVSEPVPLASIVNFSNLMKKGSADVYVCQDYVAPEGTVDKHDKDGCHLTATATLNFDGFEVLVNRLLFGADDPTTTPPGGLVGAIQQDNDALATPQAKTLLANIPSPLLRFLKEIHNRSPSAAMHFAHDHAKTIAYYTASHTINQMFEALKFASFELKNPESSALIKNIIANANKDLREQMNQYRKEENIKDYLELMQHYRVLITNLPSRASIQ